MGHKEEERNTNLKQVLAEGYSGRCIVVGVRMFCFFREYEPDG